ncbi:hypothetical protein MPDQ_008204 [Monascus purpureus]|uniref:Ubiquinone/menaquinone biosynthesis-related protein n=1 Tax=Monascus purpureus TaxID=5098 RepID=A0A507QUE4_MONPU|nr:hypothetical protein MPDQ_008204 [Monascus purpureus]BDD56845.1 hypothetical protein MAP00_002264 [Monascus purpureus]
MSASRVGRASLAKAKVPVPRAGSRIPAKKPGSQSQPALLKRTNPHLVNLKTEPPASTSASSRVSPKSLAFFGVGVLLVGIYSGSLYATYKQEVKEARTLQVPDDVSDRYNDTATVYDSEVDMSERLMRMGKRRKELIKLAHGDVLEISCGTGRNMEYYEFGQRRGIDEKGRAKIYGCRTVTFIDLSPQMVDIARQKFEQLYPNYEKNGRSLAAAVLFRVEDAKDVQPVGLSSEKNGTAPIPPSRPYFDTIVQTMGICSMPDPIATLRHLGTITEPQNGRILLLEHGRSYYDWLNRILDNLAPAHADKHGCWWNRDIGEIVRQSGLEVVEEKRWHLGTTWRYVLRVKGEAEGK